MRSIASLIRNLVDTHDTMHELCGHPGGSPEWNAARDVLVYYVSHQLQSIGIRLGTEKPGSGYEKAKSYYWTRVDEHLKDRQRRRSIRDGRSIFTTSRSERIRRVCGDSATFVAGVLDDLSTYVHSIPPVMWLKTLDQAFSDTPANRDVLAVWLRIATFYFANAVRVVLGAFPEYSAEGPLEAFLSLHVGVFD